MVDVFYPSRPNELEDICLYDFVQWMSIVEPVPMALDYIKGFLNKPHLPNHKLFDPTNENQREDYYYSDAVIHSISK